MSKDALLALQSLRRAVAKALERKRLLGQYAVVWQDGKTTILRDIPPQQVQLSGTASETAPDADQEKDG